MPDQPLIMILKHIDYAIFAPKARFNPASCVGFALPFGMGLSVGAAGQAA